MNDDLIQTGQGRSAEDLKANADYCALCLTGLLIIFAVAVFCPGCVKNSNDLRERTCAK